MPEYLAPGVFVEETSFRQKTIEGVSTSTTGFAGPSRFGPVAGEPELLTSFADFERIYGGIDQLRFADLGRRTHNYLAHAVRAYFEEGGRRLYVSRVFHRGTTDGAARWSPEGSPQLFSLRARHPGAAGNFRVTLVFRLGDNTWGEDPIDPADPEGDSYPVLRGIAVHDTVVARGVDGSPATQSLYWVDQYYDGTLNRLRLRLRRDEPDQDPPLDELALDAVDDVRRVTVSVIVDHNGRFSGDQVWEGLALHPQHPRSLSRILQGEATERATELYVPLVFDTELSHGAEIAEALMGLPNLASDDLNLETVLQALIGASDASEARRSLRVQLSGGDDGEQPNSGDYEGRDGGDDGLRSGLRAFEDVEDVSIVAVPGASFDYSDVGGSDHAEAIARRLVTHCERMRYRVAILDASNGQILSDVRDFRGRFDSTRAALYYPWLRVFDPLTEQPILVPPSGHVAGVYARNDIDRGVHKAPANEIVRLADGLELVLNTAQQEVLNPLGINCLRFFEGRGYRIWGARTASSDPEWKYLNVRRYFAFLERSIERGTQWAVFENNGDALWANVRRTIEDFLFNEWRQHHLLGTKPGEAYFVRCDRSTMTQNDLDNGRLVCLIGVAPLRPAEFVIFRIGQKTADAR
jgi:phage tail sheath protein FI